MKLILLKPYLLAKSNGGEISMIERLLLLRSWGIDVKVEIALPESSREKTIEFLDKMNTPLKGDFYMVDGLKCHVLFHADFHPFELPNQRATEKHFIQFLEKENPDLVWTHFTDFFAVTAAVQWNAEKTWVVLTDNEYPRLPQLEEFPTVGVHYKKIKTTMVASRFMQKSCRQSFPFARSIFVPNPVLYSIDPVQRSPQYWVFVNPTKVKGVEFVLELAKKMPQEDFLFVGNWATEMPEDLPKNISSLPRQNGLREVFSKAKGLLMPSVWDEAFGRLVLEAMAAGVPVISSDRGALPETVGPGGIVLPLDLTQWGKALSNKPTYWIEQIAKGFDRANAYRLQTERRFKALKRMLKA